MSNTESSAISRLIADAQGPVSLELRQPAPRMARGTMAPQPAPHATGKQQTAPHALGHDEWFDADVENDYDTQPIDAELLIEPDEPMPVARQPWPAPQQGLSPYAEIDDATEMARLRRPSRARWIALSVLGAGAIAAMAIVVTSRSWTDDAAQPVAGPTMAPLGQKASQPAVMPPVAPVEAAVVAPAAPVEPAVVAPAAPVEPAVVAPAAPAEPAVAASAPAVVAPAPVGLGTLELRGVPRDALVELDGQPLGRGPMRVSRLAAGQHRLEVKSDDGKDLHSGTLVIDADDVTALRVDATPARPAPVAAAPAEKPAPAARPAPEDKPARAGERAAAAPARPAAGSWSTPSRPARSSSTARRPVCSPHSASSRSRRARTPSPS
jgi:hypothetical protein